VAPCGAFFISKPNQEIINMTTQITQLPTAYAPASFTSRLSSALAAGNASATASTAATVAADKSALFSFSSTGCEGGFTVEVSLDAGSTWKPIESFIVQPGTVVVRMYTPNEAVQIRAVARASGITTATVSVASLVL
jgi:hypothetical protein